MSTALIAASILDADLGDLAAEVRRAERAGAGRIHLDVMDGHFVPNLTFGPRTIAALRDVTGLPFDAHLMISEPGRYVGDFLEAGCDSITFHVEVDEAIEPTLLAIREHGRAAGLAIKPGTPLDAVAPYRDLLDIVMIMTVEPGFGGQRFIEPAGRKALAARAYLSNPQSGQLHVDGGVNRETARLAGELGFDVLVVGSALWRSPDLAAEVDLITSLADGGRASGRRGSGGAVPTGSARTGAP